MFLKLFILKFEIIAHGKNILIKLSLSIYNHQLFLTLIISSSPHINDNNHNTNIIPILDKTSKFLIEFMQKNIGINSR
jgi:hypothetical protein